MDDRVPLYGLSPVDIEKIRAVFKKFTQVESVVIYGSRAKGNYRTGSDIDLTIKTDGTETERLLFDVIQAIDDLDLICLFDISLLADIKNRDLLNHIERVGCEFYRRKTG